MEINGIYPRRKWKVEEEMLEKRERERGGTTSDRVAEVFGAVTA